ncbi:conjugal transfer protein TraG, partial [Streptomyces sp. NPDC056405]
LSPVITQLDGMWTWDSWSTIQSHVRDLRRANEAERVQQRDSRRRQAEGHAAAWAQRGAA